MDPIDLNADTSSAATGYFRSRSSRHEYLEGLSDARCQSVLHPGQVIELPCILQTGCVIVPGQILPLLLRRTSGQPTMYSRVQGCVPLPQQG